MTRNEELAKKLADTSAMVDDECEHLVYFHGALRMANEKDKMFVEWLQSKIELPKEVKDELLKEFGNGNENNG